MHPTAVSCALLAAGAARRMGRPKLLLDIGGRPILRRVAEEVAGVAPAEVLVIVSAEGYQAIATALRGLPVRLVVNGRAAEGLGTSIAAAAAAVSAAADALLLLQGDQPLVDRSMLGRLVAEWRSALPPYVASDFAGVVTTPVVFSRALFGELGALEGDRGARAVLERHAGRVVAFPAERGRDVDTPEDYRRLLEPRPARPSPRRING